MCYIEVPARPSSTVHYIWQSRLILQKKILYVCICILVHFHNIFANVQMINCHMSVLRLVFFYSLQYLNHSRMIFYFYVSFITITTSDVINVMKKF